MKKIINGKVYDTETAKECGYYENTAYRNDFNWWSETLYQKKTGEFFIHGDGNANSRYSKKCGANEWCGDEVIKPISYDEAVKWAEKRLEADEYIRLFGEPAEDNAKTCIHVYLPATLANKLKTESAKTGKPLGDIIAGLLENM